MHISVRDSLIENRKFTCKAMLRKTLNKCLTLYDHYAILGDLNYDLLSDVKKRPLTDFMELFSLTNIIKEATCFKKNCTPSLLDVILTNSQHLCMRTLNFTTGVSDCHNLISTVINSSCPSYEKTKISYRSFRNFEGESFVHDLSQIRLSDLELLTGAHVNNIYNNFEKDVTNVINKHFLLSINI